MLGEKNLQMARKDFVTAKPNKEMFSRLRAWCVGAGFIPSFGLNPLQAGWNKDPVGFAGRALQHKGSSVLLVPGNFRARPFPPLRSRAICSPPAAVCGALPGAGRAGGRVRGSGVASAVTLSHTKG